MSKSVYIVVERTVEYDDEYYNISEGSTIKNGFASHEEAVTEALKQNEKFLSGFNLGDFSYSGDYDVDTLCRILDRHDGTEELVDELRDDPHSVSFDDLFKRLREEFKCPEVVEKILHDFDFVAVKEVKIK